MTVAVTVDMLSATPPYEQVRSQIAGHIRTGSIRPGERLPVVRALAADLGVATNTVARAYRELETAGLVQTRGRNGTLITSLAAGTSTQARQAALAYAETTRALGVPPEAALGLVRAALGLTG